MIDIENKIYTGIVKELRLKVSKNISTSSEMFNAPPSFPHVSICEENSYPLKSTMDSNSNENHDVVLYDINIYSNKPKGYKQELKNILSVIDDYLFSIGFVRLSKDNTPVNSNSLHRMTLRYEAVVSKDNKIYRRT